MDASVSRATSSSSAGLVSVRLVALDGSLLAGNASPGATRSYASIRAEVKGMLAEASQADAEEDERLGDARGDELPAELVDARSRLERRWSAGIGFPAERAYYAMLTRTALRGP